MTPGDPPPIREGGPTELVETDSGDMVERLSAGTATMLLLWLIAIGGGSALLAVWVFVAVLGGERLGVSDLFSSLGFYVAIFGASGPVILWLTGRAQGHSLGWYLLTALKMGAVMVVIFAGFTAVAALITSGTLSVGSLLLVAVLAVPMSVLAAIWALATWSADWYIARVRADS